MATSFNSDAVTSAAIPPLVLLFVSSVAVGVLPMLVATRHGFRIVAVERRIAGRRLPFAE